MMAVPMVGRAGALDELRGAWSRVRSGRRPVTAVVTGAAGTGKTALVTAFRQERATTNVLAGTARVHSPAPYDWLAAVLAGRDTRGLDVPPDALAWLKQDPDVPRERYTPEALLRIAVAAVRGLVGTHHAVLVVEDLHALDPASLNLIAELGSTDLPVLLLVTSQPAEAALSPELTTRTLARLGGHPGAVRRHLGGLLPAEVGEVLRHVYGSEAGAPELAEAVWRRTDGNPYRLSELIAVEGAAVCEISRRPELTAREREVLGLLAEGMPNKQIARVLGISVRTVTVHVSNLLRKTGASSRTEAALWALSGRRSGDHHVGWRDNDTAARSQSSA
ncbi:helix-turn-helix domain-containing protein [Paractinoplanes toevensis]|nr:helix-turn-helix transcriptional regulator [Actinoplanes toevensis]